MFDKPFTVSLVFYATGIDVSIVPRPTDKTEAYDFEALAHDALKDFIGCFRSADTEAEMVSAVAKAFRHYPNFKGVTQTRKIGFPPSEAF